MKSSIDASLPGDEPSHPDYAWDDLRVVSSAAELAALFHPLREQVLDLLLERAATVRELARAVGRPPSTVAHHVGTLVSAGLVKVVRTRRVRAIDERFYGRTARLFYVGSISGDPSAMIPNYLQTAAAESAEAHRSDDLRAMLRYARIPEDRADELWRRVMDLFVEFAALPRTGERGYALVAGLYPADHPTLAAPTSDRPPADPEQASDPPAETG